MWLSNTECFSISPPEKYLCWMQKPKNMGDSLRKVCSRLSVIVLSEQVDDVFADEHEILNLSDPQAYIRRIFLAGDGVPFCYCRVTVPMLVYRRYQSSIDNLGNKLIGETLLYNNPRTIRSAFEFARIDETSSLFFKINEALPPGMNKQDYFWARRSVFCMNAKDFRLAAPHFASTKVGSEPAPACFKQRVSANSFSEGIFGDLLLITEVFLETIPDYRENICQNY